MSSYRLARMSPLFRGMTGTLLLLPGLLLIAVLSLPGLPKPLLGGMGLFVLAIYGSIWLFWRPSRFEIDGGELRIIFPLRRRVTHRRDILSAEVLDMKTIRRRYPRPKRVGAGGLWGGFGWLRSRNGWLEFYISRSEPLVLVQRRDQLPLLISPERPEAFAAELRPAG